MCFAPLSPWATTLTVPLFIYIPLSFLLFRSSPCRCGTYLCPSLPLSLPLPLCSSIFLSFLLNIFASSTCTPSPCYEANYCNWNSFHGDRSANNNRHPHSKGWRQTDTHMKHAHARTFMCTRAHTERQAEEPRVTHIPPTQSAPCLIHHPPILPSIQPLIHPSLHRFIQPLIHPSLRPPIH